MAVRGLKMMDFCDPFLFRLERKLSLNSARLRTSPEFRVSAVNAAAVPAPIHFSFRSSRKHPTIRIKKRDSV